VGPFPYLWTLYTLGKETEKRKRGTDNRQVPGLGDSSARQLTWAIGAMILFSIGLALLVAFDLWIEHAIGASC